MSKPSFLWLTEQSIAASPEASLKRNKYSPEFMPIMFSAVTQRFLSLPGKQPSSSLLPSAFCLLSYALFTASIGRTARVWRFFARFIKRRRQQAFQHTFNFVALVLFRLSSLSKRRVDWPKDGIEQIGHPDRVSKNRKVERLRLNRRAIAVTGAFSLNGFGIVSKRRLVDGCDRRSSA